MHAPRIDPTRSGATLRRRVRRRSSPRYYHDTEVLTQTINGHEAPPRQLCHRGCSLTRERSPAAIATHESGREVQHVFVDQSVAMELSGDVRPTLDHQLHHAAPTEFVEQRAD